MNLHLFVWEEYKSAFGWDWDMMADSVSVTICKCIQNFIW